MSGKIGLMEWKVENNRLVKTFKLKSFSDITTALVKIAQKADAADHHPDFEVFGYNTITFKMFTHTDDQVTDKDYALAREIDQILELNN